MQNQPDFSFGAHLPEGGDGDRRGNKQHLVFVFSQRNAWQMVAQLSLPFLPDCTLPRLLLGARLSSSFPSKALGQATCADDTRTCPRVLLLQLFIVGAQEPGERFWVHRTFVSLLCLSAVMGLLPSWQPVLFLGLSKGEAAPESRAPWC